MRHRSALVERNRTAIALTREFLGRVRAGGPLPGAAPETEAPGPGGQVTGPPGTAFEARWRTGRLPSVAVFGELDLATVPALARAVAAAGREAAVPVNVDLRHATFIDTAGVAELERAATRWPGVRLEGVPASVARVVAMFDATHLLSG